MGIRIKQGDTVEVVTGDDQGVRGKVLRVIPARERAEQAKKRAKKQERKRAKEWAGWVVVTGVNIVKKHQRPVRAGRGEVKPGIIEFEAPIHLSDVMLVCPHCNARTRVAFVFQEDGRKMRMCKKCDQAVD